jgi:hypothetical protein
MSPSPVLSWTETIKAYFWLAFFVFATFMLSYGLTGQYLAGMLVGIVILYFAYRLFFVVGDLSFTPRITRPAVSFAIVLVILILVAYLGLFIHWQPWKFPEGMELIRHVLTIGIPLLFAAAGYVYTRFRKE